MDRLFPVVSPLNLDEVQDAETYYFEKEVADLVALRKSSLQSQPETCARAIISFRSY